MNIIHSKEKWYNVILWWEIRRILFNVVVILGMMISIGLTSVLVDDLQPGEDLYEPIIIPIFLFIINGCYTMGWMVHLVGRSLGIKQVDGLAPVGFSIGLGLTVFLLFIPTLIHFGGWLIR